MRVFQLDLLVDGFVIHRSEVVKLPFDFLLHLVGTDKNQALREGELAGQGQDIGQDFRFGETEVAQIVHHRIFAAAAFGADLADIGAKMQVGGGDGFVGRLRRQRDISSTAVDQAAVKAVHV